MAGKSQADFRAMLMSKKSDAAAFPVSNGRPTAVLGDGRPTADSVRAMAADAAPKKIPGGAKTYEEAMAEAGGDAAKITGLVMPKPSSRPKQDGPSAASGYGRHAESGGGRRERNKDSNRTVELGEQKKAKKEAKRKDVDEFELVCPKEETIVRIETWVREFEASKSGGDVRCTRTMDMLHLSQFRPGFEMTDSAQGLQWKLKLTVVESGLFTSNETKQGLTHGDKTLVRAVVDGGFEKKAMWEAFEQMKADVCRTNRKWRRIQQRGVEAKEMRKQEGGGWSSVPAAGAAAGASAAPAAAAKEAPAVATEPIDLSPFESEEQLLFKGPGANALKAELMRLGLKCGGAPAERAARLFRSKGMDLAAFKKANPKDIAQEGGKKKRKRKVAGDAESASAAKSTATDAPMDVDMFAAPAAASSAGGVGGFVRSGGFTEDDQERIAVHAKGVSDARKKGTGLGFGS